MGHNKVRFESRHHGLCSCSLLFCQSCIADAELVDVQADKSRVKDYINRLDNFDGPAVGEIAVGYEMFEEAFEIYKKFGLKSQAIKVLLDHQNDLDRAFEYAGKVGSRLHILHFESMHGYLTVVFVSRTCVIMLLSKSDNENGRCSGLNRADVYSFSGMQAELLAFTDT